LELGAAGCALTPAEPVSWQTAQIPGAARPAVIKQAVDVLEAEGFIVPPGPFPEGVIRTLPVETGRPLSSGRLSDYRGRQTRMRRVATVAVTQTAGTSVVRCRVDLERYESQSLEMFEPEYAPYDAPIDTPAERGAALTDEQNSLWVFLRRDHASEQRIERAIVGAFE
jgi:hypothetical protein